MVRIGQRQGGLVSPICKNTSPRSYGSAKNESPSALGYNGQQKPLKGPRARSGTTGSKSSERAAVKDKRALGYNGQQKPLKGPVKDESTLAYAGKQKPLRGPSGGSVGCW